MKLRGYFAYAGSVVQLIDEHPETEHVTVRYKHLGFDACVPVQDIESILTVKLTLAVPPEQRSIEAALLDIQKDHGYEAAAFAIRDILLRSWSPGLLALRMVSHEILRNDHEGNEEHVWAMGLIPLLKLVQQFCKDYNEVI